MAAVSRDQALSLLAAANNHGDLAVKLSSLKQVRGILSSADPSLAAELFPYLVELQSSPESLVRKSLIETIEDIGLKAMEHSSILMPVLLAFLRDGDSGVAGKSIVCGTNFFCRVLEEITMQFRWHGKVERWLEELWTWMVRFKDAVFAIALEPGLVGTKLLALKFLETHVLLFTSDSNDFENFTKEGSKQTFNISWLSGGHPFLDPVSLTSEANRMLGTLMDLLQSACNLPGSVIITVVNCYNGEKLLEVLEGIGSKDAIGRKRPLHHNTILSALLDFNPNFETGRGCHAASVQYSLRTAFLGFLRCTNPTILEAFLDEVIGTQFNSTSIRQSRDRLLKALRAINAGDTADQVVRQVDKMIRNSERARENRVDRNDQPSTQLPLLRDLLKKRSMPQDNEERNNGLDVASKRVRYGPNNHLAMSAQMNESWQDSVSVNGVSPSVPLLDSDLNPVEQMIAMIAALLAEGERGAESLELLISNIHPDLLADIVISNMKHLHKTPPPLTRLGNLPVTRQIGSLSSPAQVVVLPSQINTMQSSLLTAQVQLPSSVAAISSSLSDTATGNTSATDSKRDPRRDPRRLDPRRVATPVGVPSISTTEDAGPVQSEFDDSSSITRPPSLDITTSAENLPAPLLTSAKSDDMTFESPSVCKMDQPNAEEGLSRSEEIVTLPEVCASSDHRISSRAVDEDSAVVELSDVEVYGTSTSSLVESDQHTSAVSNASAWEETCKDLPPLPLFVELTEEEQKSIDADEDIVMMLQKYVVANYQEQKGHELVLHILYHLQSLMISSSNENSSYAAAVYEKLLLAVAKSLLDTFPASDKSFSRLLGEVPVLPDSVLQLLDDLCSSAVFDLHGKEVRDGERVTQGLGAVWSLILGRPYYRQACLDIALKSAAHSQDEIRAKAIRLVSNKLYQLSYITENIEQYATNMMLSAVNQHSSNLECSQSDSADLKAEGEVGSQETSISGSQVSEPGTFEMDSVKGGQPISHSLSTISFPEAQRLTSLFFALCTKKPRLLQLIFDKYVQAPKSVKQVFLIIAKVMLTIVVVANPARLSVHIGQFSNSQMAFHRHIPILIRALGSSCSELLHIISDPPQGSENLLTLVLQILTQETTPSSDLIATVKHLYETKLKVLPIFPRLVDLPLEKFQMALAHILQITDACSACFEQRTVFTQQVLAKALNQMVDQTPLPLLFMRTVIQAIDAFPTLVDFVMEILSKLVSKQVWRMPKLWVGFLKCVSQTRPHSFPVLLKLPPPQLESALNKYANLRGPLATYASQPSLKSSIPRSILAVLGLANESHMQQLHISSLNPSDTAAGNIAEATNRSGILVEGLILEKEMAVSWCPFLVRLNDLVK
ncbi:Symplekin [Citrus sinensis]|uniref:Symplekin n=1 Tax=Citrus sinensis TaxID=2711 RepID=A0ACB8KNV0_CITSI|nr:Symplekin [Citrus sinensis]